MFSDCVIMAGGSGTRLWPASSRLNPKQFLSMPGLSAGAASNEPLTFFNAAVDRALQVIDKQGDGRVLIVCGRHHIAPIVKACQKYSPQDLKHIVVIPEPEAKNTAPAIACAANFIDWTSAEDRTVLVLTSDHIITPLETFKVDVSIAEVYAAAKKLAVFGIKPLGPETGYGYIETGEVLSQAPGKPVAYKVKSFHEKPNAKKAQEFIDAKNFYWNSGMFAFSTKSILKEFHNIVPDMIRPFYKLRAPDERSYKTENGVRILWEWLDLDKTYKETKNISFDYAIAEKSTDTVMVGARFNWLDIGSWDEYASLAGRDNRNNGQVYQVNSKDCFVDADIPVALIGAEDLIVVARSGKDGHPGSVLVVKKGQSQDVKEIVEQIKLHGHKELL